MTLEICLQNVQCSLLRRKNNKEEMSSFNILHSLPLHIIFWDQTLFLVLTLVGSSFLFVSVWIISIIIFVLLYWFVVVLGLPISLRADVITILAFLIAATTNGGKRLTSKYIFQYYKINTTLQARLEEIPIWTLPLMWSWSWHLFIKTSPQDTFFNVYFFIWLRRCLHSQRPESSHLDSYFPALPEQYL